MKPNFTRNQLAIKTNRTINDFVKTAHKQLSATELHFGHGTDNAFDEAVSMVQFVLKERNLKREDGLRELSENHWSQLTELLNSRIQTQKPLPYLTNQAFFAGLEFFVDERVIVPRSPIAELILGQFDFLSSNQEIQKALDLCCGSGCIGLAMAYHCGYEVTLSDISRDALNVCEINFNRLKLQKSMECEIVQSDLFNELDDTFDLIVSNPPYVSSDEYSFLPKEYLFEPKNALIANHQGLKLAVDILKNAPRFLNDGGHLILEVGNTDEALNALYPNAPFLWLEFEYGGIGVLAISKEDLMKLTHPQYD